MHIAATFAVILAWLFATNQCALARPATAEAVPHSHSSAEHSHAGGHEHGAPHEHGGGGEDRDSDSCCQSFQIPALTVAKSPVQYDADAFTLALDFASASLLPDAEFRPAITADDTGPPGLISFAESVLQRSLLAHAPPTLG